MMIRHELSGIAEGVLLAVDEYGDPEGPVVTWFHGELGPFQDPPLSDEVMANARVLAFHHPGWGISVDGGLFERLSDMATSYLWALDRLNVAKVEVAAGHGIGASILLELAVQQPDRIGNLVAAAPFGLWDDEIGGADLFALMPSDARPHLYADPDGKVAHSHFPRAVDAYEKGMQAIQRTQTLGPASRFLFPIPDTGISGRLYRLVDVRVHIVWGQSDGILPIALLEHWRHHLPGAEVTVVDHAAHMVPYETPEFGSIIEATVFTARTPNAHTA